MEDGVDQVASGGEVPHGFGDVRLAQRQPVVWRAAVPAPAVRSHVILRGAQFADGHELPMLIIEHSDFVLQHWEEPRLDAVPQLSHRGLGSRVLHA
jgi:hypothetical protein